MKPRQKVRSVLHKYQRLPNAKPGFLGNGAGLVDDTNHPGYVYVRIANAPPQSVVNKRCASIDNLPVWIGYDSLEPNTLQVLSIRSYQRLGADGLDVSPQVGTHAYTHQWFERDTLFVDLRQMMPFRPQVDGSMNLHINRGITFVGNEWRGVESQDIDMTPYIPITGAVMALAYYGTSGTYIDVSSVKDLNTLTMADVPDPTSSTVPLAIIRLYSGMSGITENKLATDLADPRWMGLYGGTGGGTGIVDTDEKVKISATDTTANYLQSKLVAGNNIWFVKNNSGANETLTILSSGTSYSSGTSSSTAFTDLTDVPSAYTGEGGKIVAVKATEDGLEFITPATIPGLNHSSVGVTWIIDGTLVATSDVAAFVSPSEQSIGAVYVYCIQPGASGSTVIDIKKNGFSIFGDGTLPTVVYNNPDGVAYAAPTTINLLAGDVLTLDIEQVAVGARNLSVVVELAIPASLDALINEEWHDDSTLIGEHPIMRNGKLYAPLVSATTGQSLKILDPLDGTVLKSYSISSLSATAPVISNDGHVFVWAAGTLWKINETTDVTSSQAGFAADVDFEALVYDPVNDRIFVPDGTGLKAIKCSDLTTAWTSSDPNLLNGVDKQISPFLLVGNTLFVLDYDGTIWKLNATTGATIDSLNLSTVAIDAYAQMIFDAERDYIYVSDSVNRNVYAINAIAMTKVWTTSIAPSGWTIFRGGAYHAGVVYVTVRQSSTPFRSTIKALDADTGTELWVNSTAYDNNAQVSSLLVDDDYVYATTYDYSAGTYNKIMGLNVADGTVAFNYALLTGSASCIPVVSSGKFMIGLWNNQSIQAIRLRSDGGAGDFDWKADTYHTGYVGQFSSGSLIGH